MNDVNLLLMLSQRLNINCLMQNFKKYCMKKIKMIYYISTSIVCAVILFSVINFTFFDSYLFPEGAFQHLHLPHYFKWELTIAKVLGLFALTVPGIHIKIKEFAYFGFAITLISAAIAHASTSDAFFPYIIDPVFFLVALIFSYVYYHKMHQLKI